MKNLLLCLIMLLVPTALYAETITDKEHGQSSELELRGEGVRSKFFIDLYKARLHAPATMTVSEILSDTGRSTIVLEIVSSMITSEKMETATREGFEQSLAGKALYKEEIEQFIAVFKEQIVEEDIFVFRAEGQKVEVLKNKALLTTIDTAGFRGALFGIWLGDDPVSEDLKEEMLGK